jgi:hypothetical protein
MEALLLQLLKNPAVLGAITVAIIKALQGLLSNLDKSDALDKYKPQIHIAFLVLSFLASLANAAENHQLSTIDLSSVTAFITYFVTIVVGGKAMSISNGVDWKGGAAKLLKK